MSARRRSRVSKTPVTTRVETLSHDGRGLARLDGKATFIDGALQDESVTFEYTRKKRDFDEGRVLSIEEASPNRVVPRCPHHEMCGGCSLQHLDETLQIHEKEKLMLDVLTRVGHVTPEAVKPPLSDLNPWHYRHRARLSVNWVEKKGRVLVGFREKHNPRYVADLSQCFILHQKVGDALGELSALLGAMDNPRIFAQIEVAAGDEVVALVFRHLESLSSDDEARFRSFSDAHEFRIYLQPGGLDTVHLFYPEGEDALTYTLPEQAITFSFYPTDFTQVNARLNRKMLSQALDWLALTSEDVVLDLFCGLGNFSLPMAKYASRVVGVEGSEMMVERASHNARQNKLDNTQFLTANLDDAKALLPFKAHGFTKVLLDPPRTGALEVVQQIEQINPEYVLYVSCNPATFARDAGVLISEKKYRLLQVGVMDMFPHTTHVEVMALFKRG
jgi:23S rRNA (uracil1939-C5)-methyltransferase